MITEHLTYPRCHCSLAIERSAGDFGGGNGFSPVPGGIWLGFIHSSQLAARQSVYLGWFGLAASWKRRQGA